MSYKIESVNNCTKKFVFNFESVDLTVQISEALQEKQKTVELKGFRKGKAPLDVVSKMYGAQVENDALYRFVSKEFFEALEKEEVQAIGYPRFANTKYEQDSKKVEFEATVETYPDFELADYSKLSFTQEKTEVKAEEVEALKKQYIEGKSELKTVDSAIEIGHSVTFDFEGEKENGEKPDSMKAEGFNLEVGSNQFIPGFEDGMIGMKRGEEKTIELTFPETYHVEDLKGAPVKFKVKVNEIQKKEYPEMTDDLAKEFGFESTADFNKKTEANLIGQRERQSLEKLHQEILEKLVAENSFEVPTTMIAQQRTHLEKEMGQTLKSQGFNDDMMKDYFSKWADDMNTRAEFQVRSGLILNRLADEFKVEVTEQDWDNKYNQIASQSGMELDQVKSLYGENEQVQQNLNYAIREEKTFDALKAKIQIS